MLTPEHVWGISPGGDRIWAQVSGLAPGRASRRVFVVLQAFIDESEGQDGTFAIGGHVASAEAWSKLAAEWEQMLPLAVMDKNGQHHFKMSEMAATPERMARVPGFYRLIEAHVMSSIQVVFNTGALRRAIKRVHAPGMNLLGGCAHRTPRLSGVAQYERSAW